MLLILISIITISCIEEIDIVEFTDEFGGYTPELRVEALMLPHNNTAVIRIDQSISIDDESLFDCIDQNNNWIGEECVCSECDCINDNNNDCDVVEFEIDCNNIGGELVQFPLSNYSFFCDVSSISESDCSSDIFSLEWALVHDCGIDGLCPGDFGYPEPTSLIEEDCIAEGYTWNGQENVCEGTDFGEGNGVPDCGEKNVDDIEEITEYSNAIHVQNCEEVKITYNSSEDCFFKYADSAAVMYEGQGLIGLADGSGCESGDFVVDDISDLYNLSYGYGAWVPDRADNRCNVDFNNYELGEYSLTIKCGGEIIKSNEPEKIPYPVIFVESNSINDNDVGNCTVGDEHAIYECLENFEITSTSFELIDNNETNDLNSLIYVSTSEWYQAVQYNDPYYSCSWSQDNQSDTEWFYYHGHAAVAYPPTDETNHFPSYPETPRIFTSEEVVVSDSQLSLGCFKYDIFTFSEGYQNYYFYSQLNLKDPSRSNLRDSGGDVVIGAFGAMSGKSIPFSVVFIE